MSTPRLFENIPHEEEMNLRRLVLMGDAVQNEIIRQVYLLSYPIFSPYIQSVSPMLTTDGNIRHKVLFNDFEPFDTLRNTSSLMNADNPDAYRAAAVCDLTTGLYQCVQTLRPMLMGKTLKETTGRDISEIPKNWANIQILEDAYIRKDTPKYQRHAQEVFHAGHPYRLFARRLTEQGIMIPNILDSGIMGESLTEWTAAQVFAGIDRNSDFLFVRNTVLAEYQWYQTAVRNNPFFKRFLYLDKKTNTFFIRLEKIAALFEKEEAKTPLPDLLPLLADIAIK